MKKLTEQWKDMDLVDGHLYYWRMPNGEVRIMNKLGLYSYKLFYDEGKVYILEPVPSYDKLESLQKQLKEAKEVIKLYAETTVGHKQKNGTYGMWVCSGEVAWGNPLDRINTRMNYLFYDPRPAKKWLKKWKV